MILQCNETKVLHPAGIFPAVCVDVIDLGVRREVYDGEERLVPKVRIVFETEVPGGLTQELCRTFTASLNPKARLNEFLGKWRGKPYLPGDAIDLDKVQGVSATLVVSHQGRRDGNGLYAAIDAVSRQTKRVVPSGKYDKEAARARIREQEARSAETGAGSGEWGARSGMEGRRNEAAEPLMADTPF